MPSVKYSRLATFGVLLLALGCRRTPTESEQVSRSAGSSGSVDSLVKPVNSAASVKSTAVPDEKLTETELAEVRGLVDAWTRAQNERDFSGYEKLYAEKFTGIKRSGPRARTMNRKVWLEDRKGMFDKPFEVQIESLALTRAGSQFSASFEQTWKSASYRDRGKKSLLLARENGTLRIAREEMLASEIAGAPRLDLSFERAALGVNVRADYALLTTEPVDLAWATAHPEYLADDLARRDVVPKALPEKFRKLLEGEYEVFTEAGKSCRTKALRFDALARVEVHDGQRQTWEDSFAKEEGRTPKKVPPAERALLLWSLASNHPMGGGLKLALVLEGTPECPTPLWGRRWTADGPRPFEAREESAEEKKERLAAIGKKKELLDATRVAREEASVPPGASWFDGKGLTRRFLSSKGAAAPKGGEVSVVRAEGPGGCGLSTPWGFTFFDEKLGSAFSPLGVAVELPFGPMSLVDFDGDGRPEVVTETAIYSFGPKGLEVLVDQSFPSYACPC